MFGCALTTIAQPANAAMNAIFIIIFGRFPQGFCGLWGCHDLDVVVNLFFG